MAGMVFKFQVGMRAWYCNPRDKRHHWVRIHGRKIEAIGKTYSVLLHGKGGSVCWVPEHYLRLEKP